MKLATVFSGIGAIEQALHRMGIDYEIVFACDNGDVELNLLEGKDLDDYTRLKKLRSKKQLKKQADIEYLDELGIGTIIHYLIPPYLSKAYEYLGHKEGDFPITENLANTVISIPMYDGMTKEEQDYIINALNNFDN